MLGAMDISLERSSMVMKKQKSMEIISISNSLFKSSRVGEVFSRLMPSTSCWPQAPIHYDHVKPVKTAAKKSDPVSK